MLSGLNDLVRDNRAFLPRQVLGVGDSLLDSGVGPDALRLEDDLLIPLAAGPCTEYIAGCTSSQNPQLAHRSPPEAERSPPQCPKQPVDNYRARQCSRRLQSRCAERSSGDESGQAVHLGREARIAGKPARGKLGEVWPVHTDRGKWAVKHPFEAQVEQDEEPNAAFAELVYANGITTPQTIRTPEGRLLAEVEGEQFRVYSWVDIEDTDKTIEPALVGGSPHSGTPGSSR